MGRCKNGKCKRYHFGKLVPHLEICWKTNPRVVIEFYKRSNDPWHTNRRSEAELALSVVVAP